MFDFKDFFNTISENVTINDSHAGVIAGVESSNRAISDDSKAILANLEANVSTAISSYTLEHPDVEFGEHQIKAAVEAAKYATAPLETIENFSNRSKVSEHMFTTTLVPSNNLSDTAVKAGIEAFADVDVAASMYFSIAFQSLALKQDPVAELFYPIVVVDANKTGFTVEVSLSSILTPIKRDLSGKPIKNLKESLVKKLNDTSLFTLDANRLYPVVRTESADKLLNPAGVSGIVKTVTVGDGYEVQTAPIKANVEVDLLDLSQTDELVAKGIMDETDMLNTHLSIEKLYFELTGKDSDGNDVTEYFERNIKGLPAVFTHTNVGSKYDLELTYNTESIAFVGGNIIKTDGNNTAIDDLTNLAPGHYVKIAIRLKGDANVETGNFVVNPTKVEMVGIYDAAGNPIDESSTEYTKVAAVFNNIKLVGILPEAYAENDNARFNARTLATDTKVYAYKLQRRHIIREVTPVAAKSGNATGEAMVDFTRHSLSKNGLLELVTAASVIENIAIDAADFGMASDLYFRSSIKESIDVATIVDGVQSSTREDDIVSALKLKIKNIARKLYVDSNYSKVFNAVTKQQGKPTVIIGTDITIGTYINNFSDDMFNYVVARTDDSLITGTVYISFGVMGKERNLKPNILNFGVCGWSPEVVLATNRSSNGRVAYETLHMPVYRHQTILPILAVLSVSGIEAVSGKITALRTTV